MNAQETLTAAKALLESLRNSNYIPVASPASSSTESKLKGCLNAAIDNLSAVISLDNALFDGRRKDDRSETDPMKILGKAAREMATERILKTMRKHGLTEISLADFDCTDAPVIQNDENDVENIYTLDEININEKRGTFSVDASNSCDNITLPQNFISTDALLDIADWIEGSDEALAEIAERQNEDED